MIPSTERAAYDARLAELEHRYRSGEWTIEQLNAAVVDLDAEFHIGEAEFTPKENTQ